MLAEQLPAYVKITIWLVQEWRPMQQAALSSYLHVSQSAAVALWHRLCHCLSVVPVYLLVGGCSNEAPTSHGAAESAPACMSYVLIFWSADRGLSNMQISCHCGASVPKSGRNTVSTSCLLLQHEHELCQSLLPLTCHLLKVQQHC